MHTFKGNEVQRCIFWKGNVPVTDFFFNESAFAYFNYYLLDEALKLQVLIHAKYVLWIKHE